PSLFSPPHHHRHLHSFPTRRSSDLTSFDPHAKLGKDIAAGAVLIATVNAVAIGYLVFARRLSDPSSRLLDRVRNAPIDLTLIALDRKSTRLNSSHVSISYAVFCLKK